MPRNFRSIVTGFIILAFALPLPADAQRPDLSDSVRKALSSLPIQPGIWEGNAWYRSGPGDPETIQQVERVETRLDGVVLLIEGVGRGEGGDIVHHAFATMGWDPVRKQYRMNAWLSDGSVTEPTVSFADGILTWSLQLANGPHIRYRIWAPEKDLWEETGHISLDGGETWQPFFGMTLSRVEDEESR